MKTLFVFFMLVGSLTLSALESSLQDKVTGETFPGSVTIDHDGKHYVLDATGVSTRKKLFINVYAVASYLQQDALKKQGDVVEEILNDEYAKQLTIKWVRNIEAKKVQDGYQESFHTALGPEEFGKLQNAVNQYIELFNQDVKKGDVHELRWLPGGYVEVKINGKSAGNFTDPAFAHGLWSLWFGPKSVVNRNQLISLVK